jgi:hypothetical protein
LEDCSGPKAALSGTKTNLLWAVYNYKPPALPEVADTDAFFDATPLDQIFDRVSDVDESPTIRDFKPQMICHRFHIW